MHTFTEETEIVGVWRRFKACTAFVIGLCSLAVIGAALVAPATANPSAPATNVNPWTKAPPPPAAPARQVCVDLATGRPKCKPGYTHRLAGPDDYVCVHPDWHRRAQIDNELAASNANPDGSCRSEADGEPLFWREAFPGDRVCVSREVRMMTREQNQNAAATRACN